MKRQPKKAENVYFGFCMKFTHFTSLVIKRTANNANVYNKSEKKTTTPREENILLGKHLRVKWGPINILKMGCLL